MSGARQQTPSRTRRHHRQATGSGGAICILCCRQRGATAATRRLAGATDRLPPSRRGSGGEAGPRGRVRHIRVRPVGAGKRQVCPVHHLCGMVGAGREGAGVSETTNVNFWTIGRVQELLGDPDGWPKMRVEDENADVWLDGYQARYTIVDKPGFAYAWVPGERMARLFAAAPEALAWCVDAITNAYALANSYATTNETQRQRIDQLLALLNAANARAETAEAQAQLIADRWNDMIDSVPVYVEYVKVCENKGHKPGSFSDRYACSPPGNVPPVASGDSEETPT